MTKGVELTFDGLQRYSVGMDYSVDSGIPVMQDDSEHSRFAYILVFDEVAYTFAVLEPDVGTKAVVEILFWSSLMIDVDLNFDWLQWSYAIAGKEGENCLQVSRVGLGQESHFF